MVIAPNMCRIRLQWRGKGSSLKKPKVDVKENGGQRNGAESKESDGYLSMENVTLLTQQ